MKVGNVLLGLLAGGALALAVTSASADGFVRERGSVKDEPHYYNWSGVYLGLQAGGGWAETDWNLQDPGFFGTALFSTDPNGWLFGGHLGVNHQWGPWVAGVEVSYAGSTMKDTVVGPVVTFPQDRFTTRIDDLFALTGRLGFASKSWLVYAKGGYANAEVSVSGISGPPVAGQIFKSTDRADGWTAGGGVEWMIHRNLILGVEYNFISLDGERFTPVGQGPGGPNPLIVDLDDIHIHTVMGRLSIKFDRDRAAAPLK
jgi:outer membrane immunogenic protein